MRLKGMTVFAALLAAASASAVSAQSFSYNYASATDATTSGSFTITGVQGAYQLASFMGSVAGATYGTADVTFGYDAPDRIFLGAVAAGVASAVFGTNDFFQLGSFTPGSGAFTDTLTYTRVGLNGSANVDIAVTQVPGVAAVPEPASWGMMILGFGVVGGAMRRRKSSVRASVRFA